MTHSTKLEATFGNYWFAVDFHCYLEVKILISTLMNICNPNERSSEYLSSSRVPHICKCPGWVLHLFHKQVGCPPLILSYSLFLWCYPPSNLHSYKTIEDPAASYIESISSLGSTAWEKQKSKTSSSPNIVAITFGELHFRTFSSLLSASY